MIRFVGLRKLSLVDAEQSLFIRVNHITRYGTDPHLEGLTIQPPGPLSPLHRRQLQIEGQTLEPLFFDVALQPEVGEAAYTAGATQLTEFFHTQLASFRDSSLAPLGRSIIDACLDGATVADYAGFTP